MRRISKLIPLLEAVHERLSSVVIECMDYKQFLQRYDRKTTLFYLDPPYLGHETDYGVGMFAREDFTIMADRLAQLEGKFILSLNDVPAVRAGLSIATPKFFPEILPPNAVRCR